MSYIGNTPTQQNFVAGADQFNGNGSTTAFTLSRNVNTVFDIFVAISNVPQDPYSAYSVSGNTLTFTSAPPSGTGNIYVTYRATNVQTFVPTQGVSPSFGNLTYTGTLTGSTGVVNIGSGQVYKDTSGNVGIGTSSPAAPLDVKGVVRFTNSANVANYGEIYDGGGLVIKSQNSNPMYFFTSNTERARIDSSGNFQFNSGYGSVATAYGCRAWVNFNGTGTVAIRASGNVTSITDNGAGDYTVNFTNAMPDANYCVTSSNKYDDANTSFANGVTVVARYTTAYQTGSVRVQTGISAATDTVAVCVAIFR